MILAIINGIITSIMLETIILLRQMPILQSFKTALGMSIISMLSMEIVMNILLQEHVMTAQVDFVLG